MKNIYMSNFIKNSNQNLLSRQKKEKEKSNTIWLAAVIYCSHRISAHNNTNKNYFKKQHPAAERLK